VCIHCGCGIPDARHGNKDSITIGDVNRAMKVGAHDKGVGGTAREMQRMVRTHASRKRK
jgi:hypothetical protein